MTVWETDNSAPGGGKGSENQPLTDSQESHLKTLRCYYCFYNSKLHVNLLARPQNTPTINSSQRHTLLPFLMTKEENGSLQAERDRVPGQKKGV